MWHVRRSSADGEPRLDSLRQRVPRRDAVRLVVAQSGSPSSSALVASSRLARTMTGRHRSPPVTATPRAPTVIAVAAAVLTAASLTAIVGQAVAPDASGSARTQVSTVTRAERTTAGPLELPTIGVVAPAIESLYPTPSAAPQHTASVSRGTRTTQTAPEPAQQALVAITGTPEQTVTPTAQPVTDEAADTPTTEAPSPDPAAVPTDSAPPTEEQPVETPEPTVDVDVTGEVGTP
jgi:hypothetical protein